MLSKWSVEEDILICVRFLHPNIESFFDIVKANSNHSLLKRTHVGKLHAFSPFNESSNQSLIQFRSEVDKSYPQITRPSLIDAIISYNGYKWNSDQIILTYLLTLIPPIKMLSHLKIWHWSCNEIPPKSSFCSTRNPGLDQKWSNHKIFFWDFC